MMTCNTCLIVRKQKQNAKSRDDRLLHKLSEMYIKDYVISLSLFNTFVRKILYPLIFLTTKWRNMAIIAFCANSRSETGLHHASEDDPKISTPFRKSTWTSRKGKSIDKTRRQIWLRIYIKLYKISQNRITHTHTDTYSTEASAGKESITLRWRDVTSMN